MPISDLSTVGKRACTLRSLCSARPYPRAVECAGNVPDFRSGTRYCYSKCSFHVSWLTRPQLVDNEFRMYLRGNAVATLPFPHQNAPIFLIIYVSTGRYSLDHGLTLPRRESSSDAVVPTQCTPFHNPNEHSNNRYYYITSCTKMHGPSCTVDSLKPNSPGP